jgi:hypothetical protein
MGETRFVGCRRGVAFVSMLMHRLYAVISPTALSLSLSLSLSNRRALSGTEPRSLGRKFIAIAKAWKYYGVGMFEVTETSSGYKVMPPPHTHTRIHMHR